MKRNFKEQSVDQVADILDQLRDERFGNADQRRKFAQQLVALANMKDQRIRAMFKQLGNFMSDFEYDRIEPESEMEEKRKRVNPNLLEVSLSSLRNQGKRLLKYYNIEWNYRMPYVAVESKSTGDTVYFAQGDDYDYTIEGMGGDEFEGDNEMLLFYLDSAGALQEGTENRKKPLKEASDSRLVAQLTEFFKQVNIYSFDTGQDVRGASIFTYVLKSAFDDADSKVYDHYAQMDDGILMDRLADYATERNKLMRKAFG